MTQFRIFAISAVAVALCGCDAGKPPTDVASTRQSFSQSSSIRFRSTDDEFAYLNQQIPGFGGMYMSNGQLRVHLKSLSNAATARRIIDQHTQAVAPRLWRLLASTSNRFVFDQGQYDFNELLTWKRALRKYGGGPIVFLDADEARNRVHVGVSKDVPGAAAKAVAAASAAGVPMEALYIEEVEPPTLTSELTDSVRPVIAGLQIFGPSTCTLGVNVANNKFLTASHCSQTWGVVDSSTYSQGSVIIGTETRDPSFSSGGSCTTGYVCRDSDVAEYSYETGISKSIAIAKTNGFNSIEITGSYGITGSNGYPYEYEGVRKVGRSTGGTWGIVTITCSDTFYSGGKEIFCQTYAEAAKEGGSYLGWMVAPGDSGSPVFTLESENYALFAGIVSGMSGNFVMIYSSVSQIESELGTLYYN